MSSQAGIVTTAGVLAVAVVASAVGVVNVRHEARNTFIELQALNRTRD